MPRTLILTATVLAAATLTLFAQTKKPTSAAAPFTVVEASISDMQRRS